MYHLNEFCNIIAALRKEKGWTQVSLAERLGVAPQSVSKWECGIGYPDVTLFPVIAETLSVPIGTLFGENLEEDSENRSEKDSDEYPKGERKYTFPKPDAIYVMLGNPCRVELIRQSNGPCSVAVTGDPVFLHYFDIERSEDGKILAIHIKNPSGSTVHWAEYDRLGYEGENLVKICAAEDVDFYSCNFLDLSATARENENGNHEVLCEK